MADAALHGAYDVYTVGPGAAALTWEEPVHFDLWYVEYWSVAQDVIILWRALHAVVSRGLLRIRGSAVESSPSNETALRPPDPGWGEVVR